MFDFKIYKKAIELPDEWDMYTENPFQKKEFLVFLEEVNPCSQNYHISKKHKIILITYKLKLNIFTFANKWNFKIPITILGIPLSVGSEGYSCTKEKLFVLEQYIKNFKLLLILNTNGELSITKGLTLPNYIVNSPESLEQHISKMRSHYRYRAKKALLRGKKLRFVKINPLEFNENLYSFYEEVFERSEGKLEKLNIDFFKKCNADIYKILDENNSEIGFFQSKKFNKSLIFLFCGFDHSKNKEYDLYLNILLKLIDMGCNISKIYFGQTTDYSKSRLGAISHLLYLHLQIKYVPKIVSSKIISLLCNKPVVNTLNCMHY